MTDQTRKDWIPLKPSELGTLALVSKNEDIPRLLQIASQYASETFRFDDEELTKFYFFEVPYAFLVENHEPLAAYFYVWIPGQIRDSFKGTCGGEDCAGSRICRRPGCVCTQSKLSGAWKCR